jgi:hypothetical protein
MFSRCVLYVSASYSGLMSVYCRYKFITCCRYYNAWKHKLFFLVVYCGSSGSIVSDYGLDDRSIEVRSPTGADFSSSPCVQTGSGAHPASYPMGTGVLSPGIKRGWGVTLTTHPHLVPRLRMSRSYTSSPPSASMACSGRALLYFLLCIKYTPY